MSVFETFYLLFKADTSDIKKGSKEATDEAKKLNDQLGLLDQISDIIGDKFLGIGKSISLIAAGYLSARSIFEGFKNAIDYDIELGKQSRFLGVSAKELDAYDRALRKVGGSTFDFENLLKNLSQQWNTNASNVIKVLPQLSDIFNKANRFYANALGQKLNLTDAQILFLRQGPLKIASEVLSEKKLGVVTDQDIEQTTKYNQEILDLTFSISKLYQKLAIPVLPYLIDFFHDLNVEIGKFNTNTSISNIFLDQMKQLGDYVNKNIINPTENVIKKNVNLLQSKALDFTKGSKLHDVIIENGNYEKDLSISSINESINNAKKLLEMSGNTPFNYQTPSSILNSNSAFNRNTTINTGPIEIVTQANDAEGIAKELGKHFNYHLGDATNNFANNVYA